MKQSIKPIYTHLVKIIFFVLCILYFATYIIHSYGISTEKVYHPHNNTRNWLISFADGDVHKSNQNFLNTHSVNKGFDVIISYDKQDIDPEYYEKHKGIFSQKRGAGYWLWKPYIIKKTLNMMAEGDVLFYIDSGNTFQTNTDFFIDKLNENKDDIILFRSHEDSKDSIKKDAYIIMQMDERYRNHPHLEANTIILRKTFKSVAF